MANAKDSNKSKNTTRRTDRRLADLPRVQNEYVVNGGVKVRVVLATEEGQHNRFWGEGNNRCDVMIVRIHGYARGESEPMRTAILANKNINRAHSQGLRPMFQALVEKEGTGVWEFSTPHTFQWITMVPGTRTRGTLAKVSNLFQEIYTGRRRIEVREEAPAQKPTPEPVQDDPNTPKIPHRDLQGVPDRFRTGDRIRLGCGLNLGVLILNRHDDGFEFEAQVLIVRAPMPEDGGPKWRTEILLPKMEESRISNLMTAIGEEERRKGKRTEWEVEIGSESMTVWCRGTRLHLEDLAEMINDRNTIDWPESVFMA